MSLKPCKFTPKGSTKELSYDEFRAYLLENYDDVVPPQGGGVEPSESDRKGRVAGRAKRIEDERNQEYKDMLEDYTRNYNSVDMASSKTKAEQYFDDVRMQVEDGDITPEQAHKMVFDYVQELIFEDDSDIVKDPMHPLHKTAFAMMVGQRMLADAIENGMQKEATKWNDFFDSIGRASGTKVAMLNSVQTLDPLSNIIRQISKAQSAAMNQKAKSGRKKKDIVADIQEEVEQVQKEAAGEVVDTTSVEAAIDSASEVETPKEKKRTPSKRTELEKREKAAIERVKKAFASKSAPGPLMAATPENAERVAAIVELAKVEIEKGAYTLGEAVAAVFKKVGQYASKRAIREAIESEWANLSGIAQSQKQQDLTDMVKEAISGKSTDKIIQSLGKAIKMARPEYIKAQMKNKRITEAQAIEEILSNPAEAEAILNQALNLLKTEVAEGKHLDLAGGTKPKNLSQEQWDAARAKKVLGQFQSIIDSIVGRAETIKTTKEEQARIKESERLMEAWNKAAERRDAANERARQRHESAEAERIAKQEQSDAERELKEAERAYEKHRRKQVKEVIKNYYGNKNSAQSLNEYLAERFPEMTMNQINELAAAVEDQMRKNIERRDKTRIKKLVKEMTDGRDEANAMKVVAQGMATRGAMNTYGFNNLLSQFLGFKGVPQNVVNNVTQMMAAISQMPQGSARAALIAKVNNMIAPYVETGWSYWDEIINTLAVKNILSSIGTAFTGGLSVVFLTIPRVAFNLATRPIATTRGLIRAFDATFSGKSAIRSATSDTFLQHRTPVSRELPADDNPYAADSAWARTRKMSWKDAFKMWETNKGRAISHLVAKALINFTFQGKHNGVTNVVNDFQAFLDYLNLAVLRDMYLSVEAEKQVVAKGISPKDPRFKNEVALLMGRDPQQLADIENQITQEENKLTSLGQPIPKGFRDRRRRELINENSDDKLLAEAHFKAVSAMGMGNPETIFGAGTNALFETMRFNPKVKGQMNGLMFVGRRLTFPLTLFSRMMLVLGERAFQYTPIFGPLASMLPYTFTKGPDGFPMIRRFPDGTKINNAVHNQREYAARILVGSVVTTVFLWFLSAGWDEEEVEDPRTGKPIPDPTNPGENIKRRRYKWSNVIDFYGDNPTVKAEMRGSVPRNAIRVYDGTNEDGTPKYKDYPMQSMPLFYGIFKAVGNQRDSERYFDEQVIEDLSDKGNLMTYLETQSEWDPIGLSVSAGVNAFTMDFSAISRIADEVARGNTVSGTLDVIGVQQAKSVVNPRVINDIERQLYNMTGRHKIYVNYKMKDDGLDKAAEYLMKDVWFTDPFIFDREKFESVDPFGNKIEFPPVYTSFVGMFGGTTFEAMAIHESEHKDEYGLYRDEKGQYNPKDLSYPTRYIRSSYTKDGVEVNVGTDLRRKIADDAYINHGELVRKNMLALKRMSYEKRAVELEYIWDWAKYMAVKDNLPDAGANTPKREGKSSETVQANIDALLAKKNLKK